jgi:hypothetical protein
MLTNHRAARAFALFALLISACGGDSPLPTPTPTPAPIPAPAPAPTPTPAPPAFADMNGKWSGTFESSNLPTRIISAQFVQAADCVDGAWASVPAEWTGAFSGFARPTSFDGAMSFQRQGTSGVCAASGQLTGEVKGDLMTLTWAIDSTTGVNCVGLLPVAPVLTLRRQ